MSRYRVFLVGVANVSIVVETDLTDPEEIYEEAMRDGVPGLCASCSGWGQPHSLDLSEEWEPEVDDSGTIVISEVEG